MEKKERLIEFLDRVFETAVLLYANHISLAGRDAFGNVPLNAKNFETLYGHALDLHLLRKKIEKSERVKEIERQIAQGGG